MFLLPRQTTSRPRIETPQSSLLECGTSSPRIGMIRDKWPRLDVCFLADFLAGGELIRQVGISEQTFYSWKRQYAGLASDQLRSANSSRWSRAIRALSQARHVWDGRVVLSGWLRGLVASLRLPGGSRRRGCSGDVAPDAEGCGAGSTVIIGAQAMTTKLEVVADPAVG